MTYSTIAVDSSLRVDIRRIGGAETAELYITARLLAPASPAAQARSRFKAVAEILRREELHVFSERIYGVADEFPVILKERRDAYGMLDDGIAPAMLTVPIGRVGSVAGVAVYAVRTLECITRIEHDGRPAARLLETHRGRWLSITGLTHVQAGGPPEQTRQVFADATDILSRVGMSLRDLARTWFWLADINDWYDDFNHVRTHYFKEHGLIDPMGKAVQLPASTGINIRCLGEDGGADCGLDLIAAQGAGDAVRLAEAGGDQNSAYAYGSAFSRACVVVTPAGETVFVSGTAAIDRKGMTQYVGCEAEQIEATLMHVHSLLKELGCTEHDIVTAAVYCKTPSVERLFHTFTPLLIWPHVTMIAEVCRPNLLFEVEVAASRRANSLSPGTAL
jgi:enamine deaminase RidA (YjgF/YER057c/UK114 family)